MTGRCLIIANQTLGGSALDRAVTDCIIRDLTQFHVVVPLTPIKHEAAAWYGGFELSELNGASAAQARAAVEATARQHEADYEEAHRRAQDRLDQMIARIETMGGRAEGEIGDEDPLAAAKAVLERESPFDEVIVSTLPSAVSRWLKMDLPSRIARVTDAPMTTIKANDD